MTLIHSTRYTNRNYTRSYIELEWRVQRITQNLKFV